MTIEERDEARDILLRRTAWAYKRVFASPEGRLISDDLKRVFGIDLSTFMPTATRPGQPLSYDPYYGAIRSGQRDVWLHIQHQINLELDPEDAPRNNVPFETVPRDI
jgi:hypothetical protein